MGARGWRTGTTGLGCDNCMGKWDRYKESRGRDGMKSVADVSVGKRLAMN